MILRLAADTRCERDQITQRRALNLRTEEDHDVFFGFERGLQLQQRFRGRRVECAFAMGKPADCSALATLGGFDPMRGLAMDIAFDAVDDVEASLVMAHAGANLPGDQRILLRDIVSDQQDGGRGVDICTLWRERFWRLGPRAAARPA